MAWNNGIRDMKREREASGSGPVKTYKMSPEELEDYLSRNAFKAPKNRDGEKINQPVQHGSVRPNMNSEELSRRENMKEKKSSPDKQTFLKLIASGKSIAAAEKEMGLRVNGMYYWLNKWNLKGITPKTARDLLNAGQATPVQETTPGSVEPRADLESEIKELRDRLIDYEHKLVRWSQSDSEKSLQLAELQEDRDNWKQQAELYQSERDGFKTKCDEIHVALSELETERQLLLNTIEKAATSEHVESDNVNHPAHYTAGSIECIDAIEAAVEGLSGPLAYSTGAAIKYLWRYSRKNGIEDLQKAAWYVNRLVKEVERLEQSKTKTNDISRTTA